MYLDEADCMKRLNVKGFGNKLGILKSVNQALAKGTYESLARRKFSDENQINRYINDNHSKVFSMMQEELKAMEDGYLRLDFELAVAGARNWNAKNFRTVFLTRHYLGSLRDFYDEFYNSVCGNEMRLSNECIVLSQRLDEIIGKIDDANYLDGLNFNDRIKMLEKNLKAA